MADYHIQIYPNEPMTWMVRTLALLLFLSKNYLKGLIRGLRIVLVQELCSIEQGLHVILI
jgi:hypothetical protein